MTIDKIYPPEDLPAILASLHSIPDLEHSTMGFHKLKDGTVIEVQVSTRDVGKGSRYVIAQDVTEKKKYQQQLQQAQRMESLGQLAGGVAHDFNNLLGVIINFSWFVKANLTAEIESGNGERLRPVLKDMERIERAAENAARLTHQLLAFARVDVVQPRAMDMNVVVAEMAPILRRTLGEHIDLVAAPGPALWPVMIDSGQLSQVLTNLAVNSRDAMPKGGRLTIDVANVDVDFAYAAARPNVEAGPLRPAPCQRHRGRHGQEDAGAHLRTVFHDQASGAGHGSWPGDDLRHRDTGRGEHRGVLGARPGHPSLGALAGHRPGTDH